MKTAKACRVRYAAGLMGFDCTLHVVDPGAIRDAFCTAILSGDVPAGATVDDIRNVQEQIAADPSEAAKLIAGMAIRFAAAALPAAYERGFCLSLWAWQMEDESQIAEVPKKHRATIAEMDELFAPLVKQHPQLKGKWPVEELTGNGHTGLYIPPAKVPGLLKWVRNKVKTYAKANRRLFRQLILVLEEAERRGLAFWEASDVASVQHPVQIPEHLKTPWLEEARFPAIGIWELVTDAIADPAQSQLVFGFVGIDDFLCRTPATAIADLQEWPPKWRVLNEGLGPVARSNGGQWIAVVQREAHTDLENAVCVLETRPESIDKPGIAVPLPMSDMNREVYRYFNRGLAPKPDDAPPVDALAWVNETPVILLKSYGASAVAERRPGIVRDGRFVEPVELAASDSRLEVMVCRRLADGRDILVWNRFGYAYVEGQFRSIFELWPEGWSGHDDSIGVSGDAIVCRASLYSEQRSSMFLAREGHAPIPIAESVRHLSRIVPGPGGAVLAKQIGPSPQHLGCILWPTQGKGGEVLWFDDDLFPDEDPDNIASFVWAERCGKLLALADERIWAVPIERVLALPRFDAMTGRRLRGK